MTVIVWIAADLVHIAKTEKLPSHDPRLAQPVKVHIDTEVITKLEQKK